MTTATKAAQEPCMINPMEYVNRFAEWKHPKNVDAQTVCKYNTIATFSNTLVVSTIVSLAVACFSNFIVLGLVLTAASGFALFLSMEMSSSLADKISEIDPNWNPVLLGVNLGNEKVPLLLRCISMPKAEAAPVAADGKEQAAPCEPVQAQSRGDFEGKGLSSGRV